MSAFCRSAVSCLLPGTGRGLGAGGLGLGDRSADPGQQRGANSLIPKRATIPGPLSRRSGGGRFSEAYNGFGPSRAQHGLDVDRLSTLPRHGDTAVVGYRSAGLRRRGAARRNHQASAGVFTASLGLGPEERDFGFEESDSRSFSALFDEGTRQQASSGGGRGRPTLGFSEVASDPDAASDSGDAGAHRQDVTVAGPPPVQSRRFVVIRGAASGEAGTSDTTVNVTSNQGASAQPQPRRRPSGYRQNWDRRSS